ncbi:MAG: hypothetical protein P1P84_23365 [Deferrisomatales bacterium]|nr:hypothetical protein [Deferrisomatales bacterium]
MKGIVVLAAVLLLGTWSIALGGGPDAVFDLAGEWDAVVTVRGLGSGTETVEKDVVKISQKGNEFLGIRTVGCSHISKNGEWIKGKLANGLVVEASIQITDDPVTFTTKWNDGRAALVADANQLVAQSFNAAGN